MKTSTTVTGYCRLSRLWSWQYTPMSCAGFIPVIGPVPCGHVPSLRSKIYIYIGVYIYNIILVRCYCDSLSD
ncbi:p8 [Phellodendron-associated higre-like virus]|uniref:P8 n=1 Tax=Phellodendron-associated higre-like virus TaxID=3022218 RepID=A0AAT9T5T5_9VIRU